MVLCERRKGTKEIIEAWFSKISKNPLKNLSTVQNTKFLFADWHQ